MKRRPIRSVVLAAAACAAGLVIATTTPGPAGAATVSQGLSCGIGGDQTVGLITTAPATVTAGATFTVSLAPNGSGKADGAEVKNMVTTFHAPAGSEIVPGSASTTGGSGTLGTISTTISGQTVQIKTTGPVANGASFTPPTLTFQLKATGAAGTVLKTTFRQSAAYTLTVAGSIDITCNANAPLTALTSTTIEASATSSTSSSSTSSTSIPTCVADKVPFASVQALINQQYQDFTGAAPTTANNNQWLTAITSCTATPDALIVSLLPTDLTRDDARLVRLYLAYFKRPPDPTGFAYWQRQLDAGKGLINAAKKFAESSEFIRTYGSLSNGDFIDLVYENVLGREPDPTGRAFWLTRLDNKTKNRGDVMINFSESSENVNKKSNHVQVFRLHRSMMARFPSKTEYFALLDPITNNGKALTDAAKAIRFSAAYDARV